ncbi:MAG: Abi family protein [Paludibacteraceae bacterium]|nr:Abi family protein [Paludibacteraceae bacterium]
MTFTDAKILFSPARMQKYVRACKGDEAKAITLYSYNAKLSQAFFGVVSLFEVILRNAINEHYLRTLGKDWIVAQAVPNGLLEHEADEVNSTKSAYSKEGVYSHDKMVGSFTFGFWTYLFTKRNYKIGGKTLLQIFPNRVKGTTQKKVYADITDIREFRNRIAHHEPICFSTTGEIDTAYMERHYVLIKEYLQFMGVKKEDVLPIVYRPEELLEEVKTL